MTILKVGESITQMIKGFKTGNLLKYPGEIIAIGDVIICRIPNPAMGGGTIAKFDIQTGICTEGIEAGWLAEIAGVEWPQGSTSSFTRPLKRAILSIAEL